MTVTELEFLTVRRRAETDVLLAQVRGIEAWARAHSERTIDLDRPPSRESRLDLARRRDVVVRQRQALVDWTARQLRESDHLLRSVLSCRAVLAHRQEWFKAKVGADLRAGGVTVVADLGNGADALGVVVAEQPELLVVEDKLAMVSGLDLTRAVARYAPNTVVVAQVVDDEEIGPFLEAGATTVFTRRTPPADVAAAMVAALRG